MARAANWLHGPFSCREMCPRLIFGYSKHKYNSYRSWWTHMTPLGGKLQMIAEIHINKISFLRLLFELQIGIAILISCFLISVANIGHRQVGGNLIPIYKYGIL